MQESVAMAMIDADIGIRREEDTDWIFYKVTQQTSIVATWSMVQPCFLWSLVLFCFILLDFSFLQRKNFIQGGVSYLYDCPIQWGFCWLSWWTVAVCMNVWDYVYMFACIQCLSNAKLSIMIYYIINEYMLTCYWIL
jgi:hypothetical protein